MDPVKGRGTAVVRGSGVEGWVGSAGVGGAGVRARPSLVTGLGARAVTPQLAAQTARASAIVQRLVVVTVAYQIQMPSHFN